MRRLLHVALALAACARAAPLASDEDRLPGWLGERDRDAAGGLPQRWIEPISWQPRCGALRAPLPRAVLTACAARSAFLYHGFLTPEECEHIKDVARPRMERSMVRARFQAALLSQD